MAEVELSPCPDSPNCVQSVDAGHKSYIASLQLPAGDNTTAQWGKLRELVLAMPRTRLAEERDNYIRVEFRSLLFRFVDDVEFVFDAPSNIVHIRSASRTGHYDFGVNRKRIEKIRILLQKEFGAF
jgi:uncharacterized protein (DUF1499 family)